MAKTTCGVFLINRDKKILIAHPTNHNMCFWSIPKGGQKKNETLKETAFREFYEETNLNLYNLTEVDKLLRLSDVKYKNKKKVLKSFVMLIGDDLINYPFECTSMVKKNKGKSYPEMDGFKWVDLTLANKLLHETQKKLLPDIRKIIEIYWGEKK